MVLAKAGKANPYLEYVLILVRRTLSATFKMEGIQCTRPLTRAWVVFPGRCGVKGLVSVRAVSRMETQQQQEGNLCPAHRASIPAAFC